jgi:hypothetical protein
MNLLVGFEKWVKTLPIKFASWAFAFEAILVSFTVRHSFWLFFLQSVFYRKLSKGCRIFLSFFGGASAEVKKWVNSREPKVSIMAEL